MRLPTISHGYAVVTYTSLHLESSLLLVSREAEGARAHAITGLERKVYITSSIITTSIQTNMRKKNEDQLCNYVPIQRPYKINMNREEDVEVVP